MPKGGESNFRRGADSSGLPACAICLGRHKDNKLDFAECRSRTFWSGGVARCTRNSQGRIVDPEGRVLCTDWQRGICTSSSPAHVHECSGCGNTSHGAQRCPRTEKI
ncbi:hypothetical protein FB107DRAFT_208092 [Schizophyllum commune]